jgi:superfamily II DNA or RNA helicase
MTQEFGERPSTPLHTGLSDHPGDAPRFAPGDQVHLRATPDLVGTVRKAPPPRLSSGEWWYSVAFGTGPSQMHAESDLETYNGDASSVVDLLVHGSFGGRDVLHKLVTHLKLSLSLRSQIYALFASRTTFYPYQFKPLLKFLESRRQRFLIADEVGLGKTIEAGLILTELRQRKPLKRVLIVPPSQLVQKWRTELRRRFDLDFDALRTDDARDFLRRYQEEGDECELHGILSLQALRGRRLQEQWEEISPSLDLVIVDEAGRVRNSDTLSHGAVRLLSETTDALLLLTATPVQTGEPDLFNLLRLLDPEEFSRFEVFAERLRANEHVIEALRLLGARHSPERVAAHLRRVERTPLASRFTDNPIYHDVLARLSEGEPADRRSRLDLQRDLASLNALGHVLSRTRKREVHELDAERRAKMVIVEPTPLEREFYDRVTDVCRRRFRRTAGTIAAIATMQPQRQMASCMVAMIDYALAQHRENVNGGDVDVELSDVEPEDLDDASTQATGPGDEYATLGDLRVWRERLEAVDSKWAKLQEVLAALEQSEPGAKVVVFAFFKGTLRYLERRLNDLGIGCVRVDGDVPTDPVNPERDERGRRMKVFRTDPRVRVLLLSEVGDEGIDLQFAHVLVNYDLPWNPMRVEQRIGRLHRLKQASPVVHIVNLSMVGTIEDRVLRRLYDRIRIFQRSIGDLETILGEEVRKLQHDLFSLELTPAELDRRLEESAEAIVRRQQHLEHLQTQAQSLLQSDEFFLEEISLARSRSRYVRGEELLVYLRDFLADHHRKCTLEEEVPGKVYRLALSTELLQLVRSSVPSADLGLRLFLNRGQSGSVRLSIDADLAQDDHHLELLTFHHPLIRAVTRYYEQHGTELHPVSYVRVCTDVVAPGRYAWVLFGTEITGARPDRELEMVALREGNDNAPVTADQSEELLTVMLVESESVPPASRRGAVTRERVDAATGVLTDRLNARFDARRRTNEALVSNMLASLRESHERTVELRRQQIELARLRGRKQSYIRGLETGLRNLEHAYQRRANEIEAARRLSKSYDLRGAGIVEVTRAQ